MARISSSLSVLGVVIVCILFSSVASAASSTYGDVTVKAIKDTRSKNQLNIYEGDQFIVDFELKRSYRGDYVREFKDVVLLNVTQTVSDISSVTNVILTRTEDSLYTVTSVSPVISKFGRNATVLSSSDFAVTKYRTEFSVHNSANETIPIKHACQVRITSHTRATNPGIFVKFGICENENPRSLSEQQL